MRAARAQPPPADANSSHGGRTKERILCGTAVEFGGKRMSVFAQVGTGVGRQPVYLASLRTSLAPQVVW